MASAGSRTLLVVSVILLAGCSGTLLEYRAAPATIPETALEPRGYVHGNTTELPLTYRIGPPGISPGVTARTWVSGYTKSTPENDTAVLLLHSSPSGEVAGMSVNPLGQLSNPDLIRFVLERVTDLSFLASVDGVSGLRETGTRNVTALGTQAQMVRYTGTAEIDGERVAIAINLAVIGHEGDVVVALGIHDESLDETATHAALIQQIEHRGR